MEYVAYMRKLRNDALFWLEDLKEEVHLKNLNVV